MKTDDVIEEFLINLQSETEITTFRTYRTKIYAFYEFVTIGQADANFLYVVNTMNLEKLIQSVEHYVNAGNIKSRATVDVYYSVLRSFYGFLYEKYGSQNEYFQKIEKIDEFKTAYEKKIKELHLRDSDQLEPIERSMAQIILKQCDKIIDEIDVQEILVKKKGVYSNYISSLIVKLVLLYGLKNDVIRKLEIDNYNAQLNTLTINRYRVLESA